MMLCATLSDEWHVRYSRAMTLKLVRIARLKELQRLRNLEGPGALGDLIGRKPNQVSDLLAGRASFGEKVARGIEEFAGLPMGWLDGEAVEAAESQEFARLCATATAETRATALAAARAVFEAAPKPKPKDDMALQKAEEALLALSPEEALLLYARITGPAVDDGEVERRMPATRKEKV
jgi:hypothetical protein